MTLTGGEYGSIKMIESAQRESTKQRQVFFAKFITAVSITFIYFIHSIAIENLISFIFFFFLPFLLLIIL